MSVWVTTPGVNTQLAEPVTGGDPMSADKYVRRSLRTLSDELAELVQLLVGDVGGFQQVKHRGGRRAGEGAIDQVAEHLSQRRLPGHLRPVRIINR